jgi:acyl-coenzyme A synthetase/AMP-(fatty) acid ligase
MNLPPQRDERLRALLRSSPHLGERQLHGYCRTIPLSHFADGTHLGAGRQALAGRTVLVRVGDMLSAAVAAIELDGLVSRLILCPPDLKSEHLAAVVSSAGVDAAIVDGSPAEVEMAGLSVAILSPEVTPLQPSTAPELDTEWVLFTSGTAGAPKMVIHSLAGLTGAIKRPQIPDTDVLWGTFYDVRRYGGLQILLRALLGEGSMVLTEPEEDSTDFLTRLGRQRVTHLTGTPSHWRGVLMNPARGSISPRYIRMSGEIADQAVLDALKSAYPGVPVAHAYASTEAGVGFEVGDGLEGFPASLLDSKDGEVGLRVKDSALQLRSARAALGYIGDRTEALADADGFVDTGDIVERRGDRFYFVGRRGGIINVGGLKVHPEEIEAVINRHPAVRVSLVKARRNPIVGEIVVAEVVLDGDPGEEDKHKLREEILATCRERLEPHKVPFRLALVPSISLSAGGKLARNDA